MLIKGDVLIQSITLNFSIHGKRNEWTVAITAPGGVVTEDETVEATWYPLFTELLSTAYESACRQRFPERAPVRPSASLPKHRAPRMGEGR
jgi:hypothetical protein